MIPQIRDQLKKELVTRGFTPTGASPNDTVILDDIFLDETAIGDLLDTMVARREKIFWSVSVVGRDAAKASYEDVVLAIEAIKAVIENLALP